MLFTENSEDREVFEMVNKHHRLNATSRTIGYIVPVEEAQRIAVQKAKAQRQTGSTMVAAMVWLAGVVSGVMAAVVLMG